MRSMAPFSLSVVSMVSSFTCFISSSNFCGVSLLRMLRRRLNSCWVLTCSGSASVASCPPRPRADFPDDGLQACSALLSCTLLSMDTAGVNFLGSFVTSSGVPFGWKVFIPIFKEGAYANKRKTCDANNDFICSNLGKRFKMYSPRVLILLLACSRGSSGTTAKNQGQRSTIQLGQLVWGRSHLPKLKINYLSKWHYVMIALKSGSALKRPHQAFGFMRTGAVLQAGEEVYITPFPLPKVRWHFLSWETDKRHTAMCKCRFLEFKIARKGDNLIYLSLSVVLKDATLKIFTEPV